MSNNICFNREADYRQHPKQLNDWRQFENLSIKYFKIFDIDILLYTSIGVELHSNICIAKSETHFETLRQTEGDNILGDISIDIYIYIYNSSKIFTIQTIVFFSKKKLQF